MLKAYEIIKGIYNGKPVTFFRLKRLDKDHWVHLGNFVAPSGIAKKRLAKWADEQMK